MAELADQVETGQVVNDAPIPDVAQEITAEPAEKPVKPDKPTLRQTLEKSVETVREAEAKADKAGRLHAADGKFASKEKTVEAKAPVEIPPTEKDVQPVPASKPEGPPPGLSKETKALWDSLPPAVKADAVRREQEYAKGIAEKNEKITGYQEIDQVVMPMRPIFQQMGISVAEGLRRLTSWEGALRNPATRMQAYHALGQQYGIPPSSQSQTPSADQGIPDQLRPVYDQFGQLNQQVSSIQGELQRSREEQVSQTLTSFAKDKPHFDKVRVRMGQLIQAGIVQPNDLEGAYQQAIWADPDIKATLIKEQFDKQQADALKNQTNRAQTARAAAISPSTRAPTGPVANGKDNGGRKSVRDSLMSSVKELQGDRA